MRSDPQASTELAKHARFMSSLGELGVRFNSRDGFHDGLSGHERNKLFINAADRPFFDLSGVSGCDDPGDGRAVVKFDFDRDGRLDLAIANSSKPRLLLAHNEMANVGNVVTVDVIGSNHQAIPIENRTNRDGIGTRVVAILPSGRRLVRERRAGEGYASQQSHRLRFGIGSETQIERLEIYWPSGKRAEVDGAQAGSLVTIEEAGNVEISDVWIRD